MIRESPHSFGIDSANWPFSPDVNIEDVKKQAEQRLESVREEIDLAESMRKGRIFCNKFDRREAIQILMNIAAETGIDPGISLDSLLESGGEEETP